MTYCSEAQKTTFLVPQCWSNGNAARAARSVVTDVSPLAVIFVPSVFNVQLSTFRSNVYVNAGFCGSESTSRRGRGAERGCHAGRQAASGASRKRRAKVSMSCKCGTSFERRERHTGMIVVRLFLHYYAPAVQPTLTSNLGVLTR